MGELVAHLTKKLEHLNETLACSIWLTGIDLLQFVHSFLVC